MVGKIKRKGGSWGICGVTWLWMLSFFCWQLVERKLLVEFRSDWLGAREMVQSTAVLAEDPGLPLSTHVLLTATCNSSSRASKASSELCGFLHPGGAYTHTQVSIHKIK